MITSTACIIGFEVLYSQGEADASIAHLFHARKAFAILSQDTDFCFFEDITSVLLFSVHSHLDAGMRAATFPSPALERSQF
jgi:hypothetical protein